MEDKNIIKVHAKSNGAELNISAPSIKQAISATNNRAQYFAEQAKKYSDEAKSYRDNAKYYAEQNSDVSFEYIDNVKAGLEFQISQKQNKGDYALKNELPKKLSELDNDTEYVNKTEFNDAIDANSLPSQEGCEGKVLMSDGENESWVGINSFQLFDTKVSDKVLDFEESKGWAHQGTSVYKDALAGSRYGYPDFYAKCVEEFNDSNNSYEILRNNYTVVGSPTITEYGVASGFSWGNYVKVAKSLSFNNSWEIKQKIKLETPITSTNIFLDCIGDSTEIQIFILNNNNLACSIRVGGEYIATSGSGKASLTTGLDYICKLQFTGSSYIFSYSNNGVDFNKIWEVSSTLNVNLDTFNIGYSFNNGSNDLKHFS
ncbi:hypothetical protein IJ384_06510, partial [bacterium]|nr:hypothetical protein [bacterium]